MSYHKNKKLTIVIIVLAVSLLVAILYATQYRNRNATFDGATTTSTQPSAQSDFSDGNFENKPEPAGNTLTENKTVVTENSSVQVIKNDNPIVSGTGDITLHSPRMGETLEDSLLITGYSKLQTVNYRLIDNATGVIASGSIDVIDNKFSVELRVSTNASEGRLDIFATDDKSIEYSIIEVPVRFQP